MIKLKTACLVFFVGLLAIWGCEDTREKVSSDPALMLQFSADTVFFDTVFTDMRTQTQRLRVYNPSENAVNISRIYLEEMDETYRLLISGQAVSEAKDIFLRGKDSLMVLVEATIDPQDKDLPYVVENGLLFETNGNRQQVRLLAWGQDAYYHRNGEQISTDIEWGSNRPHIVMDSLLVSRGARLRIAAGARVYFYNNAFMQVDGSLEVNGTVADTVRMESVRLDGSYDSAPAQWRGIYFSQSSEGNRISHALVRNGMDGIQLRSVAVPDEPAIVIEGSTIENMSATGLLFTGTYAKVYNTVVANCGTYSLACRGGGRYEVLHNSLVNYGVDFIRFYPSVVFSDGELPGLDIVGQAEGDLELQLLNNIIWGSLYNELEVYKTTDYAQEVHISHNLVRTPSSELDDTNLLNQDPLFAYPPMERLFFLADDSPARDKGTQTEVSHDQVGVERDAQPDLGALEWQDLEED